MNADERQNEGREDAVEAGVAAPTAAWAMVPAETMAAIAERAGYAAAYLYYILRTFDQPDRPGSCYPSIEAIAKRANMARRTVFHHIQRLRKIGAIIVETRGCPGHGGRSASIYLFPVFPPPQQECKSSAPLPEQKCNGVALYPEQKCNGVALSTDSAEQKCNGVALESATLRHSPPHPPSGTDQEQTTTPPLPPPPLAVRDALRRLDVAEGVVEVVVVFFEENDLDDKTARTFVRQVQHAARAHGDEAVRRGLADLAEALLGGQQPGDPNKLPNYFKPILDRAVQAWHAEQRARREEAERRRERQEYLEHLQRQQQKDPGERPRLFERFKQRFQQRTDAADERERRAELLRQAERLRAEAACERPEVAPARAGPP